MFEKPGTLIGTLARQDKKMTSRMTRWNVEKLARFRYVGM